MIAPAELDRLKRDVDLVALVQSRGVELRRNGRSWQGLCPFHTDGKPSLSVSPDKGLWRCFACGAGGDAIRFVELHDKLSFREAVVRLMRDVGARMAAEGIVTIDNSEVWAELFLQVLDCCGEARAERALKVREFH